MQVNFSTNNASTAFEYLTKALPSMNLTKESTKPILDLVEAGKIRIGDPFMYGGKAPVYPEPSCTQEDQQAVMDWLHNL